MLTREMRAEFEARGVIHIPQAVDAAVVTAIRERVLEFLTRSAPGTGVKPSLTARVMRELDFTASWGPRVLALVDALLGAGGWEQPEKIGQLLAMTPPAPHGWELPSKVWHLDYRAPGWLRGLPGLQLFLCLDRVEPQAGGTLCVAGVHRLVDALRRRRGESWEGASADVRGSLAREVPWLAALLSLRSGEDRRGRFMSQPSDWQGVPLQVLELAGAPGDVFAMHPWLLHAPAPNGGARPRMVVTERIHCKL